MEKICKTIEKICRRAFLVPTKSAYLPQIFAWPPLAKAGTKGATPSVFYVCWVIFFLRVTRGGQAKICGRYAENLFRVLFGTHPQFFSRNYVFFPKHFQDPPMFFRKCKFFPLKFGDPPTFLRKIQIYLSFDPLTKDIFLYSEVYSVIFGFLTSFKSF